MIRDLGTVKPGTTIYVPFHTFDSNDPSASVTITGLAVTDIEIYKDGSVTQRASDAGYTLLDTDGIDFDGTTGIHGVSIDLANNTTAGFYEAGSQYWVVIASITVDAATINFLPVTFRIGYEGAILDTTIATLASQVSFTLEEGSANNDAYNGCVALVHDVASAVQIAFGYVSDYVGATKTVTLAADPGIFTMAAGDNISLLPPANVQAIAGTTQTARDIGASVLVGDKTGFSLSATGLDAISQAATGMVEIAKAVWDRVLSGATHNIATSAGRRLRGLQDFGLYEGGAVWIDTVGGTAGTTPFENGTVTNPVDSIADAKTIADDATVNLKVFHVLPGSAITLAATFDSYEFIGFDYTMALGGQSVDKTMVRGSSAITGTFTGNPRFEFSGVGAITGPGADLHACGLAGTITVDNAGDWFIHHCFSKVAGTGTPGFDFGAAVLNTNLNMRAYSGGIEIQNIGGAGTDTGSVEGFGQVVLNANCSGGTLAIRGNFTVTDNAGGAVTLSDDARIDVAQINAEVDTALADANLDHIAGTASGIPAIPAGTYLDQIMDDGTATFDRTTDSLQAIADSGGGGPTAAQIADAVWDEDATPHQSGGTFGQAIGDPGANTETMYDAVVTDAAGTNVAADIVAVKAETALIVADTNELQIDDVPGLIAALNDISAADILTTALTEAYAADGAAPTLAQAIFMIMQQAGEFSIAGTTITVKKLDGTTTAATFTLDDASDPTSRTRAT